MTLVDEATELRRLHEASDLLVLVNVWDVESARVVAGLPGCRAVATASYSVAASLGYEDGEQVSLEEMLAVVARICAAVSLPVTADLEAGYGDVAETVRRAVGVGAVGANIEDERRPMREAVAAMTAAVRAGETEGVPFVLNARTDAFLMAGDSAPQECLAEAVERGRAFLDVGATTVFVPGVEDRETVEALVSALGARKVSLLVGPDSLPAAELERLGVSRVSVGPHAQMAAMHALATAGAHLLAGGTLSG